MDANRGPNLWFEEPVFNSFWDHYRLSGEWLKKHRIQPVIVDLKQTLAAVPEAAVRCNVNPVPVVTAVPDLVEEEDEDHISEEYLAFVAKTRRHRKERERLRAEKLRKSRGKEEEYKDIADINHLSRSSRAPQFNNSSEQVGSQRKADMKRLYGHRAEEVESLEANLQSNFNDFYDRHQPRFWPTIPIKIKEMLS